MPCFQVTTAAVMAAYLQAVCASDAMAMHVAVVAWRHAQSRNQSSDVYLQSQRKGSPCTGAHATPCEMLKPGDSAAGCTCPTTAGKGQVICPSTSSTACVCSSGAGAAAATGTPANVFIKNCFSQTVTMVAVQYVNATGGTTCATRM
jgi:hypothetical protein